MPVGTVSFNAAAGGIASHLEIQPHSVEIREQLARLLASSLFSHSKHYPALLRYVVEQTLEDRGGQLKERALGIEVFRRNPNYDTNADPVVRTSACEVRKRIAQYYHEAGHEGEIRIDLPPGQYTPEFRFPAPPAAVAEAVPPVPARNGTRWELARNHWVQAAAVALVILGIAAANMPSSQGALDRFWNPFWSTSDSVMVGLGGVDDRVAFSSAFAMARLTGLLQENRKKYDIRREGLFTLADLRRSPAIFIGAFDNAWAKRLGSDRRFTLRREESTGVISVMDRQTGGSSPWRSDPANPSEIDYGIVSRFVDPLTEKMVVLVEGMGRDATIAAGEFVTEPRYLEAFAQAAPSGWESGNLQIVLSTRVVGGSPGPPRVLKTWVW